MKRRVSSRDDLFLSALDMYTLLSLVLIGFAFVVSRAGDQEERLLDLPTFGGKTTSKSVSEVLTVQWEGDLRCDQGKNQERQCFLHVTPPRDAPVAAAGLAPRPYQVPCCPVTFYPNAKRPEDTQLFDLLDSLGEPNPSVAIACESRDSRDLEDCASLQWVMASAGFQILAVTAAPNEETRR